MALLDTVVTAGSISLGDAAAATDLPSSTALRHLRALESRGWLSRDEHGLFSSGPTLLRIALGAFRAGPYARLTTAAQPHLERIVDATEETVYLAVRDGTEAVYVATVESPRAIRHVGWVGGSVPLDGTAIGESLRTDPLPPGSPPPIETRTGTLEPDVTAVTAPVYGATAVLGAISILGPAQRLTGKRLKRAAEALVGAAMALSSELATPRIREPHDDST